MQKLPRGGRFSEAFVSFDRHNVKKVTFPQAIRALNSLCKVELTPGETELLKAYVNVASDGLFRYKDFADDMEKIPGAGRTIGLELGAGESRAYEDILRWCSESVRTRGVLVKSFFLDFDKHKNGTVSATQFGRAVRICFPLLSDGDVEVLAKRYAVGADVNYRAFHVDVTPDAVAPGRDLGGGSVSGKLQKLKLTSGDVDVEALCDRLVREVASNRVRVREFFFDFDPLRSGHCTQEQFKRALISSKFSGLNDDELQALAVKFTNDGRGLVRYGDFADLMEEAFTKKGLEKKPTATLDSRSKAIALAPVRSVAELDPEDEELCSGALGEIERVVAERRIDLVPMFKDFDRRNENMVSRDQFLRVLQKEGLLIAAPKVVSAVVRKFAGGSNDRTARVDYRAFVALADPKAAVAEKPAPVRAERESKEADVAAVMRSIKLQVVKSRIRVGEFLREFDPLRKGAITKHQLEAGLSSASLSLAPHEIDALAIAYADVRTVDATGVPLVNWRGFVGDVDLVFTTPGLELDPEADVAANVTGAITGSLGLPSALGGVGVPRSDLAGDARLTAAEEAQLRLLLAALETTIKTRGIEVVPAFQDFDRLRKGIVPMTQFRRVMDKIALPLSDSEVALVGRAFAAPSTDRPEVQYQWFIAAIDSADGILGNLPGSSEVPSLSGITAVLRGGAGGPGDAATLRRTLPRGVHKGADTAEAVVDKLKTVCATRTVRMKDFFVDYDRLRCGHVPAAKFRTALAGAKLELTDVELGLLEDKYRNVSDPSHINWRDLSFEVDGGDERLERKPTSSLLSKTGRRITDGMTTPVDLPLEDLEKLKGDVAYRIATRRVNLKPRFQDYDTLRHYTVPKNRFQGVLQTEGLVTDPKELALLVKAYEVPGGSGVNYVKFLEDTGATAL